MSGPPLAPHAEPKESLYAMSTLTTRTIVPTGTWVIDEAHSKAGFAVNHTGIATVRGEFTAMEIIDEETLRISANLTFQGVTNEIVLSAEVNRTDIDPYGNEKVGNAGIWAGAGLTDGDLAQIELEMEANT